MSYVLILTLSLLLLFASNAIDFVPAEAVSEYVHVNGKNIVDEFGRTITLRGFNLWINDWGYGPDTPFTKLTPTHMQQIKNWGFNLVKLSVYWTFWLEPDENAPSVYNEEVLSHMDWVIDMAWDAGLYGMISVRVCFDPTVMPQWAGWSTHDYVVYNQVDSGGMHGLERFCNFWRMLANRFDDHPGIIGYNPWMFPYHAQEVPDGDERVDLYNNIVSPALNSAIREKSKKIIFWSPVHCGARSYRDGEDYYVFDTGGYGAFPPFWNQTRVSTPFDDENIVYTMTGYGDFELANNAEMIWDYDVQHIEQGLAFGKSFQDNYDVPMMASEGPGLFIHHPEDPGHAANIRPIRQDRLDMLAQTLNFFDEFPKSWACWIYSGEKAGYGVLENGVTLEESAIVPILTQHKVKILKGDLDHSGVVNIIDLYIVSRAFGTKEGDGNWNPIADLDGDKEIKIRDLYEVAKDYGNTI